MPMEDFYDAAFVSRVGRSLRGFGVIAPRSDSLNNRGYVGGVFSYLSADSGVVFFSGSCSPGSRSSSSQLRLQDGAGRCGAERPLSVLKCNLSAPSSTQTIWFHVSREEKTQTLL